MSLFYDRDRNITGVTTLTGFTFSPEYGSTASFEAKNAFLSYFDKYSNVAPQGVNSIVGSFNWNFNLRKSDAQSLVDFYESQSGTGIFPIYDGSNIYRTLSGTISSFSDLASQNNQKYSAQIRFEVERNSPHLNWSGQSFVNHSFVKWQEGEVFAENDVVWFEHDLEEPTNNWFYSLSGHTASVSNHPLSTGNLWTKNLFLNPNGDFSFSQEPTVKKNEFRGSYPQRIKDQKNIHSIDEYSVSYKNLSDKRTKAVLHFLETKLGYKKFEYQIPEIYNRPKLFFCPSWNHQWNAKDSNNLTLKLIEDPLGLKGSGSPAVTLTQSSGVSSLYFSATGDGYCFYDTGNGKNLITGAHSLLWGYTGANHSVKFYGRLAGLTGSGQSLISARFDSAKNLKFLNLSGNQISNANLYYAPIVENVVLSNNNIGGFDLAGKSGLKYFDANSNSGIYLNISECHLLTGLKLKDNNIPTSHLDNALSGLSEHGLYGGLVDFSGNSSISQSSLAYVTGLTGKNWTVGYEYTEPSTTSTTSTTSATPPTSYSLSVQYSSDPYLACNSLGSSQTLSFNASSLASANRVNFSGVTAVENGPDVFYVSDGTDYYVYDKTCCDIAYLVESMACVLVTDTTTMEPTTSTTTEEPSSTTTTTTTTTEAPLGCQDPFALNFGELGECVYP